MSYNFLKKELGPKILVEAIKYLGLKEVLGKENNPKIMEWAEELGLKKVYAADEIPWCGLFMAMVVKRTGKPVAENPLWARNWLNYGTKQATAMLGDVLVFTRGSGGHVGIYVGEDDKCYHVLGGNQGDSVSIVKIVKVRCIGIRRTTWSKQQPFNVRVIKINNIGSISENEL